MKHILTITALLFTISVNAQPVSPHNGISAVYNNITSHALNASQSCKGMENAIKSGSITQQKQQFSSLMNQWKTVESEYILGEFNSEMIDTPRYLDVFHYNTNQPIQPQLKKHLDKKTTAENALFKNAFKSINALEYILYSHPKSDVQQSYIKKITQSICENLKSIHQGYQSQKHSVLGNTEKFEGILLNTLIDSSYKLKEWRIGDVIGESKKYKDKFDATRAEYSESKLSILAIHTILLNHKTIMGQSGTLSTLLSNSKNSDILNSIHTHIEKALNITKHLKNNGFNHKDADALKQLHHHAEALQKAYYEQLLGTLDITSKILEADGD